MRNSSNNAAFGFGIFLGAALTVALVFALFSWIARDWRMVYAAIERRGYDVDALKSETAVDYWKALATGRVADPQPVEKKP